jgi:hypothetical protein
MRFETRLRRECSRCTESSIRTYLANIKALARLAGLTEVPDSSASWLDAELLDICKNESLGRYKRFAIAGRKAHQAYGNLQTQAAQDWAHAVVESSVEYDRQRNEQKKTPREEAQWPEDGYQALQRLARQLYEEEASFIYDTTAPEHIAGRPLQDPDALCHPFLRMARFARGPRGGAHLAKGAKLHLQKARPLALAHWRTQDGSGSRSH